MKLADLTSRTSKWLRGIGPMHDIVVSSRVRLARNIAGFPFLSRCEDQHLETLKERLKGEILSANLFKECLYIDMNDLSRLDSKLLLERHLISREHHKKTHSRGVVINSSETASIMINEEDHLRIQVLASGLELQSAFDRINKIDDEISSKVEYAFSSKLGYLTACPTNVGTGMRVSVMLHLPAMRLTNQLDHAFRAAADMRLAVRGIYGEGSEALGDFFQISNQITLGVSEQEILEQFLSTFVPEILTYERTARDILMRNHTTETEDKIYRSLAVLQSARTISTEEAMFLLSMVRLGVNVKRIEGISLKRLNEISVLIQPAHLQKINGDQYQNKLSRSILRANFLRKSFAEVTV